MYKIDDFWFAISPNGKMLSFNEIIPAILFEAGFRDELEWKDAVKLLPSHLKEVA